MKYLWYLWAAIVCGAHCMALSYFSYKPPAILMLDPMGDTQHAGRIIDGAFERSLMFEMAQELKKIIEAHNPLIRVIITRTIGQKIDVLEKASYANKIGPSLFVSLHCYAASQNRPSIDIYYATINPITDGWMQQTSNRCIPYYQAHTYSFPSSQKYAHILCDLLQQYDNFIHIQGPYGAPCISLLGITPPALLIECGFTSKNDWQALLNPLAQSLETIIRNHYQ